VVLFEICVFPQRVHYLHHLQFIRGLVVDRLPLLDVSLFKRPARAIVQPDKAHSASSYR